jgi:hypothetical protein
MVTIGFDLDSTLSDSLTVVLGLIKERYNIVATKEDIIDYDLEKNAKLESISAKDVDQMYRDAWNNSYQQIELEDPRIPKIIKDLQARGFETSVVTASKANNESIQKWLQMKGMNFDHIIQVEHSHQKVDANFEIYVDDNVKVAISCKESGRPVILISQLWNAKFIKEELESCPNVRVAKDWGEAESLIIKEAQWLQSLKK